LVLFYPWFFLFLCKYIYTSSLLYPYPCSVIIPSVYLVLSIKSIRVVGTHTLRHLFLVRFFCTILFKFVYMTKKREQTRRQALKCSWYGTLFICINNKVCSCASAETLPFFFLSLKSSGSCDAWII